MKEDEVLMGLLEWVNGENRDVEIERQYNYYGKSGVVDLVITDHDDRAAWVIELKSDAAVKEATGANEIVRQFNKHREYFFEGTDKTYNARRDRRNFQLSFAATERCWQHLQDNWPLYENLNSKPYTHVTLDHPDVGCSGYPFQDAEDHSGWRNQIAFCGQVDKIGFPDSVESAEGVSE